MKRRARGQAGLCAALCLLSFLPRGALADASVDASEGPLATIAPAATPAPRFGRPLNVCTVSLHNFGISCRGTPAGAPPSYEPDPHHVCPLGADGREKAFCGYDVDVWGRVAEDMGLEEGRDYVHVCLGTNFEHLIDNLQNEALPEGVPRCDVGASSVTATAARKTAGLEFSQATYRNKLAVLVHGKIESGGVWGFFKPLNTLVWVAVAATIFVVPFFVFFCEYVLLHRHISYGANSNGKGAGSWAANLKEAIWHSLAYTMSIDVFVVSSTPARMVVVAYCFVVMIIANTYTANLAAFLTVSTLNAGVTSIRDLHGKLVVTIPIYPERIWRNHGLRTTSELGWDYPEMIRRLKAGEYSAIVSGASRLLIHASDDQSCSLHVLPEDLGEFDTAFAFRANFTADHPGFVERVSHRMLELNEEGVTKRMQDRYLGAGGSCEAVSAYEETNRIHLRSLAGLWIILACATGCAVLLAVLRRYCWAPLPPPPGDKKATGESSAAFVDAQSAAAHGGVAVAYYKPGV